MEIEKLSTGIFGVETLKIKMSNETFRINKNWLGKVINVTYEDETKLNDVDSEHIIELVKKQKKQ